MAPKILKITGKQSYDTDPKQFSSPKHFQSPGLNFEFKALKEPHPALNGFSVKSFGEDFENWRRGGRVISSYSY